MGNDDSSEGQSSVSANEKGRNKRKCLSDSTVNLPVERSPVSLTEFPRYEMLEQQFRNAFKELGSMMEKSKDTTQEHQVGDDELDAEWDDPITCQLEELLSNTLSTTFSDAMKKLVESGHTEEVAEWAVLNGSLFNGNKDAVSNVVDGALALLKLDEHVEMPKHSVFEGLQSLVEYTLLEMIHIVREVRPGLTVTEAMWCLLLSELSLATACGLKGGPVASGESPTHSEFKSEASGTSQSDSDKLVNLKPGDPRAQIFRPETPVAGPAQQLPNKRPSPGELGKESSLSLQELKSKFSGVDMDDKSGGSKKAMSINFKRDLLRQKAIHFEKNYRGRLAKGDFKAKVAAWGSMVLDKSLKPQSGSSSVVIKENYTKLTTSEGNDNISSNSKPGLPARIVSVNDAFFAFPAINSKSPPSPVPDPDARPKVETNSSDPPNQPTDYYAKIPFDAILQKYIAQDDKDKSLLMLVPLKVALEKELQGWTDWVNEKVMQAARKLGKDQAELKTLRQEKEEIEKSIKEKQTNDESTVKRLTEMEHALANANGQIELAKCTIHRLEFENNVLKKELEDAKTEAQGSVVKLQEAMVKEHETMKKLQSWEAERSLMLEKLTNMRRKIAEIEKQLGKAKNRQNQFKVLFKQEEKEKLKAEKRYGFLRGKKEEEDALMKVEADNIKQTAQKNKQKCDDDIKNLESMISELKLESDKMKIAALNVGYGPNVSTGKQQLPKIPKRLAVFQDIFKSENVKPERECVMCMTEEISVVFIPCAHQVLCGQCNVLHEKQGMSDCPSCRAMIDERVSVTFRPN